MLCVYTQAMHASCEAHICEYACVLEREHADCKKYNFTKQQKQLKQLNQK